MRIRVGLAAVAALAVALAAAGCGTTPKSSPAARSGGYYQDDGPPAQVPADLMATPDAVPRIERFHSGASRPYVALGRSYAPITDDRPVVERGLASWYGRQFHGNRTATGELYDMFAMSAAHPTMPLPSYARVTNLASGASVIVRVNDRGPFRDGRVIDLSYAAAMRLGIVGSGTAEVRVERITHREIAAGAAGTAVAARAEPTGQAAMPASPGEVAATAMPAAAPRWSVQLGAFAAAENAQALLARAQSALAAPPAQALPEGQRAPRIERDGALHRVLVGELPDHASASALAAQVAALLGQATALYLLAR